MAHFRFNLNAFAQDVTESNVHEKRKKIGNLLIYSCFFTYMMSMSVKGIVAAEMGFLQEMWSLTYTQTSLSNAFYFVIYGLVQIGLFIFMKKINIVLIWMEKKVNQENEDLHNYVNYIY